MSADLSDIVPTLVARLRDIGVDTQTVEVKSRPAPDERGTGLRRSIRDAILSAVDQQGSASSRELMLASGLSRTAVISQLNLLVDEGVLTPTEPGRSPKRRFRRPGVPPPSDSMT